MIDKHVSQQIQGQPNIIGETGELYRKQAR